MSTGRRWWTLLRAPVLGLAAAVLVAVGAGLVMGHAGLWRTTIDERRGQDFRIFLTSVRHAREGRSLYTPVYVRHRTTGEQVTGPPNLNLPQTMLPLVPLAGLPVRTALAVWVGAGLLALLAATRLALRTLAWRRMPLLASLALVVYLLAWAPAAAFSLTAQISLLLMLPVVLGWLAARRGHQHAAGVWMGLAAAVKPFLLLFAPYWILRRQWRALAAASVSGALFVLAGVIVFGPQAYVEWLRQLPDVSWGGHYLNASWHALVQRAFGLSDYAPVADWPRVVALLGLAGAIAIGIVTLWLTTRGTNAGSHSAARADRDWSLLLLASLLMSPLGWSYYLWLALWPVAAVIAHAEPWRRRAWRDLVLVAGLAGWLWWGRMTYWGQPHPAATILCASMYTWTLLAMWGWLCLEMRSDDEVGA
ncbi:MAG TPA: glycosyltransferase family 87 protein [Vicinamibacterales bacterium]